MILINPKRKQESGLQNFISPSKKKKPWNEEDDGEMPATQVDLLDELGATQVDFMGGGEEEEKEELPAYKLTAFGDEEVLNFVKEKEISCQWSDEPFVIGRIKFLNMPDEHKNRISRKHFEIHSCTNEDTNEKEFWLVDFSANGTMVDGELGYAGKKTMLEDGSAIGLLLSVEKDRILFGYSFSIPGKGTPKKAAKEKVGVGKVSVKVEGKGKAEAAKAKLNGVKTNGVTKVNGTEKTNGAGAKINGGDNKGGQKANGGEKKGDKTSGGGIFAVPAPKVPGMSIKPKAGFMHGVRFALVGYNESALADPKKKKLIQELRDRGATYVLHPEPGNVDTVVLNRNYFKEPASYDVDLQSLTSSLRVRFTGNTRWLEDCVREGRKLELRHEILAPNTGGVIVLDTKKGNAAHGLEPRVASQLASMLREEKRVAGAKWKVVAPLAMIASCAGMLEGLDSAVEVLKKDEKSEKGEKGEFMLGVRETHAVGYRHVLWLVNSKDKDSVGVMSGVEKVVSVVDGGGLSEFAQMLHAQRKEGLSTNGSKK